MTVLVHTTAGHFAIEGDVTEAHHTLRKHGWLACWHVLTGADAIVMQQHVIALVDAVVSPQPDPGATRNGRRVLHAVSTDGAA